MFLRAGENIRKGGNPVCCYVCILLFHYRDEFLNFQVESEYFCLCVKTLKIKMVVVELAYISWWQSAFRQIANRLQIHNQPKKVVFVKRKELNVF